MNWVYRLRAARWIIAPVVFAIGAVLLSPLNTPTRCTDGWQSPSIGIQGACSSHGGVSHGTPWGGILAAIGGGGLWLAMGRMPKPPRRRIMATTPAVPTAIVYPPCTICAAPMRRVITATGEDAGTPYLQCSRFPACEGRRALPDARPNASVSSAA